MDSYVLGIYEPLETFTGKCIAIIHRTNDNDDKLVVVPEDKFAFISLDNIQFMLQELSNNDKWDVGELKYPFGNGINFQLEVENIDEIYNNFKKNNYEISFDIEENWYRQDDKMLGNKEFLIQDPDGYLLRFMQDLGKTPAHF